MHFGDDCRDHLPNKVGKLHPLILHDLSGKYIITKTNSLVSRHLPQNISESTPAACYSSTSRSPDAAPEKLTIARLLLRPHYNLRQFRPHGRLGSRHRSPKFAREPNKLFTFSYLHFSSIPTN